jgi:NADH dehydrogenase
VRAGGIPYTILKAGVIYGRGDHMLDHLKRALLTFPVFAFVGFRRGDVAPVHVQDVARILVAGIDRPQLHDRTLALTGPDTMSLETAVRLVASMVQRKPLFVRLPVWTHMVIAWAAEHLMKEPMASIGQVRILSEGVVEALPQADSLPDDLKPTIRFDETSVREGLPNAGKYGFSDLRCSLCGTPGTA